MNEQNQKWVAAWGNAISINERRPENYGKNLTLRYPVTMLLSGTAIRITLDNFCGTEAVRITSACIAKSGGDDSILPDSIVPLTFGGESDATIPAGAKLRSDPADFTVTAGERIVVSLYFAGFTELRSAVYITGPLSGGYFAVGNHTHAAKLPPDNSKKTNWVYFLSDIEVAASYDSRAVICYGDSITAQAWPDYLMQRVLEAGQGKTAIIRKAASGTRILRQYDNITYDSYGLKGETRFPRECRLPGADTVIIQHGINDIIHPVGEDVNIFRPWGDLPTAEELIEGIRFYIRKAREYGLKVYLGTLLPIEGWRTYADFREELRCAINDWMRTTDEADGCIDFDRAVCNPAHPAAFDEGCDSGDHLHPSQAAYKRMAAEVPEELL